MSFDKHCKEIKDSYGDTSGDFSPEAFVSAERDPEDVLTISQLLRLGLVLVLLLFLSCGLNFYLALRKADLIVVDKTSGRTLAINDKDYGNTEAVQISPDNPTNRDKKALVAEFLRCLYEVSGSSRAGQVNRLLKMMEPNLSLQQARFFNDEKLLAQEKAESVNSSWELQDVTFDDRDPYIVRALGKRVVRRVKEGASVEEETQIKVKFLLMDSPTTPARNDNNYRTGFYVQKYRAEAVDGTRNAPLVLLSDERTANAAAENNSGTISRNRAGETAAVDKQ
jgi:hypothetical protein